MSDQKILIAKFSDNMFVAFPSEAPIDKANVVAEFLLSEAGQRSRTDREVLAVVRHCLDTHPNQYIDAMMCLENEDFDVFQVITGYVLVLFHNVAYSVLVSQYNSFDTQTLKNLERMVGEESRKSMIDGEPSGSFDFNVENLEDVTVSWWRVLREGFMPLCPSVLRLILYS